MERKETKVEMQCEDVVIWRSCGTAMMGCEHTQGLSFIITDIAVMV